MLAASDKSSLRQMAERRGLSISFSDDVIIVMQPARLPIQVAEKVDGRWVERSATVGGVEVLGELDSPDRARRFFKGWDIRQAQEPQERAS